MSNPNKSLFDIIKWKLIGSLIIGAALYFGSGLLGFPPVFQWMFAFYALLGFIVFVLLDLPPMKEITGVKAAIAVVVFYIACSAVYTGASNLLPQYDPEWEMGKINKILAKYRRGDQSVSRHELYEKTMELTKKADTIMARLSSLEGGGGGFEIDQDLINEILQKPREELTQEELVSYGKEVYNLYECYNCHKIGGKGGTEKRGPHMDNLGNVLTEDEIRRKIWEPEFAYAKGFLEEHEEETMPDNYSELMDEFELDALTAYLVTLKNTRVETPELVYHDHSEH